MEYTDEQLSAFKADFAKRKRTQYVVAVPSILVLLALLFFGERVQSLFGGVGSPPWYAIALVIVGLYAFTFWNWRCPACKTYFGKNGRMRHCPSCGIALQ